MTREDVDEFFKIASAWGEAEYGCHLTWASLENNKWEVTLVEETSNSHGERTELVDFVLVGGHQLLCISRDEAPDILLSPIPSVLFAVLYAAELE